MKLLNLDQLIKEDRAVTLNGIDYIIPADLNLETMLKITKTAQEIAADPQNVEKLDAGIRAVYEVFGIKQKVKMTFEEFKNLIGIAQYATLVEFITGQLDEAEKKPQPE